MVGEGYDRALVDRVTEATAIEMFEKPFEFTKVRNSIDLMFIVRYFC